MRSRASMLSLVGLAVVAACATGATPSTGTAEDEAAVRATGDTYVAAWNARDAAAIRAMLASEYHEVTPDGRHLASPADVEASMTAEFATMPPGATMSLTTEFVKFIDADHAYSGGTWSASGMPDGMPNRGSWLVVQVRDSTGWKLASGLGATDVTPLMSMPADSATM